MRHLKRTSIAALTLVVVLAACGGKDLLRGFRSGLAASGPLVNSLVTDGTISQQFADTLRIDFGDGVNCADTLATDFSAIPKDDPESKRKKLTASVKGAQCFKVIVDRQNFAKNPRTKRVSDIAEGILASLVVFYSEPGEMRASARSSRSVVTASDEKELERKLKLQVEELKAAMQP